MSDNLTASDDVNVAIQEISHLRSSERRGCSPEEVVGFIGAKADAVLGSAGGQLTSTVLDVDR